jgi:predicted  nucleic acid-binding Zn-ribbon protein
MAATKSTTKKSTAKKTTATKAAVKKTATKRKSASRKKAEEAAPVIEPINLNSVVAKRLVELYELQTIDSEIDRLRTVRGELPLEVQDLEDEVAGLSTRMDKLKDEKKELEKQISDKENLIKEAAAQVKKYEAQQNKVRNNREFDSLSKEIEFQTLEMQLAEKRIGEFKAQLEAKGEVIADSKERLDSRKKDLEVKQKELNDIIAETEKDEKSLIKKSEKAAKGIEERLLAAYTRLRNGSRNGLAVVPFEREACGGCFNSIPPQRQMDIAAHKKIIVCEHCGRILVDPSVVIHVKGE